jgi:hypothetical protein
MYRYAVDSLNFWLPDKFLVIAVITTFRLPCLSKLSLTLTACVKRVIHRDIARWSNYHVDCFFREDIMPLVSNVSWIPIIGLYIHIAGFVIGLGAVTVIDLHGFLGRNSPYWTVATTRTHKVTKPLIWLGLLLAIIGAIIFHYNHGWSPALKVQAIIAGALIINGIFLSFKVSPFLIQREKEGRDMELLPTPWQVKITISFIVSFFGWWGELLLSVYQVMIYR